MRTSVSGEPQSLSGSVTRDCGIRARFAREGVLAALMPSRRRRERTETRRWRAFLGGVLGVLREGCSCPVLGGKHTSHDGMPRITAGDIPHVKQPQPEACVLTN